MRLVGTFMEPMLLFEVLGHVNAIRFEAFTENTSPSRC